MPSVKINSRRNRFNRKHFLNVLAQSISVPTADWPTVRCWTKSSLDRLFKTVKDKLDNPEAFPSNWDLVQWMEESGLIHPIEADGVTFYLLEFGAGSASQIDPLELMMAYQPSGVACYFSAIAFHSLTSQIPSHHHLAVLTDSPSMSVGQGSEKNLRRGPDRETIAERPDEEKDFQGRRRAIGELAFSYSGISYYLTRRTRRLIPGVQTWADGPRSRLRITTFEQTLLDTLFKPRACGGPAVILETWREAIASGRLDEQRLHKYLTDMRYPSTSRRVGAMLQLMDYTPGSDLASHLDRTRGEMDREGPYAQISLLPGFDYSTLDDRWLVKLP